MGQIKEIYRSCNLCEAICGLKFEMDGDKIVSIRPDQDDPLSFGHICPKGPELKTIYEDSDRLRYPVKRTENGWERISYEEAFEETIKNIVALQSKFGNDSIGVYQGNPSVHNYGTMLFASRFTNKLNTKNLFSATSVDQLPHHFASLFMLGHHFFIPVPDIDRTKYFLALGANPLASKGSMMTAPNINKRLRELKARNGKLVVVDPRHTETAEIADKHLFIKPDTDVFFLLSFLYVLFENNNTKQTHLSSHTHGIETLKDLVLNYPPEATEKITGIISSDLRQIVSDFTSSESAVCYGRIGLSTQSFGAVCQWLINTINIITGNFDREGGAMFPSPAVDMTSFGSDSETGFDRWRSKARNLPEFSGEFPVSALADEILHPEGIKALITSAGNPALSTPNGNKLEKALGSLEFMVSIDFYINETTRFANIIIPPTCALEHEHYDLVFHAFAVRNTAKYSPAIFEPEATLKHDWEIFSELTKRLESARSGKPVKAASRISPESMLDYLLKTGPYGKSKPGGNLDLNELKLHPHGIDFGPLKSVLPEKLKTANKIIDLTPSVFLKDLQRVKARFDKLLSAGQSPFLLIGRRNLKNNNSWLHNSSKLMAGKNRCTAMIHPEDAGKIGLKENSLLKIKSRVGEIIVQPEITDTIMQGVISLPHGFGHKKENTKLSVASKFAGENINELTDDERLDELCGNAAFSGLEIELEAV